MMPKPCPSGKRPYPSLEVAEDALLEVWSTSDLRPGEGPIAVYQCEDCGAFHFTSRGPMNARLAREIDDDRMRLRREAHKWSEKWKRKGR